MTFLKKFKLIIIAVVLYGCFLILKPEIFWSAVNLAKGFFIEMLQVLPPVLVITALITVWVPSETIRKGLGSGSGLKGKLLSLFIGSVSAGPIYAAFPATLVLFRKGASISNIVIILSSWAVIKIPMLLVEANFLGGRFMIVRVILTVPAILIMGYLIERIVPRSAIRKDEGGREDLHADILAKLPNVNCRACGCRACSEFAEAVLNKEKTLEDCVFLSRKKIGDPV